MPDIGADENIAEMKRCKEKGFKAVRLHTFPSGKGTPTAEDDKFYAAALDLDMPITIHTSFPRRTDERDVYLMKFTATRIFSFLDISRYVMLITGA